MTARVTLGVPVFQGERYLPETLKSLRAQEFEDLEILISDNGSTDATEEICRAEAEADSRIRYLRSPSNRGGPWNFNNVIANANGELFKFAAADDVIRPAFVGACVDLLDELGPACVLTFPRTQLIDAESTIFEDLNDDGLELTYPTPHERLARLYASQASHIIYGVMRTDVLRATRQIRPTIGDDFALLTEFACRGTIAQVREQLFLQRRHDAQESAQGQNQVRWYAPDRDTRFSFPQSKLIRELFQSVLSSPLDPWEKVRCVSVVGAHWVAPRWRAVASDVRHAIGVPWPVRRPR